MCASYIKYAVTSRKSPVALSAMCLSAFLLFKNQEYSGCWSFSFLIHSEKAEGAQGATEMAKAANPMWLESAVQHTGGGAQKCPLQYT